MTPLALDASHGEGGGQVLRTALALAVALGRPVVLEGIRLRRPKPGLQPPAPHGRPRARLDTAGVRADIMIEEDTTALGPGTLLFLGVLGRAGFSALGRRGLPAERVADAAVDALLDWRASGGALDVHLTDQLVAFLALADGPSSFTCPRLSEHLRTVAWVVQQFVEVEVALYDERPARVELTPAIHPVPPSLIDHHGHPGCDVKRAR